MEAQSHNRALSRKGSYEPLGRPSSVVRFFAIRRTVGVFAVVGVVALLASSPARAQWWLCQHVGHLTLCSGADGSALLTCQRVGRLSICNAAPARRGRRKSGGR